MPRPKRVKTAKEIIESVMSSEERYRLLAELARGKAINEKGEVIDVKVKGTDGFKEKIYEVKPDITALRILTEQSDGKAKEAGKGDGKLIKIMIVYNGNAKDVKYIDAKKRENTKASVKAANTKDKKANKT